MLRRRAVERLTGDLGAWGTSPVLRVRVRGPDRRRVAAARGAVPREQRCTCRSPTSRAAPVYASLTRTVDDLASLAGEASSSFRRAPRSSCRQRSRTSSAPLRRTTPARAARRLDPLARGRRAARDARARRGGVRSRTIRAGRRRTRSRSSVRPSTRSRARARDGLRRAGSPGGVRGTRGARDDAVRPRAALAPSLRVGRRRAAASSSRILRSPYSGSRAQGGRLDRGPPARARDRPRRPRRRGRRRAPRGAARCRRSIWLLRESRRSQSSASSPRRCCGTRTARRRRRPASAPGSISGRTTRCLATLDELEHARGARRVSAAQTCSPRSIASTVRGEPAAAPGRVAVLDLGRARTRRFDAVFVARAGAGIAAAPAAGRAVPRRGDAAGARRATRRAARAARLRRAATAICSPPRARGRGGGSCSCARRSATRAPRARPGPFWDAVRDLFHEDDVRPAHAAAGRFRALTWPTRDAPTERERLRALAALAADAARRGRRARTRERLGQRGSSARRARSTDRPRSTHERALRLLARESFSVSELERMASLLLRMVRRAIPAPVDDRQGDRPDAARLDPPCRAAALLRQAAERDPGSRPGDARRTSRPRSP